LIERTEAVRLSQRPRLRRGHTGIAGAGRWPAPVPALPAEARAQADRRLVAAERTADRDHRAIADRTLVADRKRALAVLEAHAHAHPVLGAHAGRAGGHVEHRRAHRALLVDAAVLLAEALAHLALVGRELVVPGRELRVGVGVGRRQRLGRGAVDVGLGLGIHGGGGATAVARDLLVAAGGDAARGRIASLVQLAAGHRGHAGVAVGIPRNAAVGVARTGAAVQLALARGRRRRGAVVRRD